MIAEILCMAFALVFTIFSIIASICVCVMIFEGIGKLDVGDVLGGFGLMAILLAIWIGITAMLGL